MDGCFSPRAPRDRLAPREVDAMDQKTRHLRPALGPATRHVPVTSFTEPARSTVQRAVARAEAALAEDFKGITADRKTALSGLFPIFKTGVSTQPIADAARDFAALLTDEQRKSVHFEIDSKLWRSWQNMHVFLFRHGLLLDELSERQREAALNIVRSSLSASGYDNARDFMRLNHHAGELTGRADEFGEWYYWISIFGQPSAAEPWGWQIDGHHLIVNCFILGDQLVMTPDFRGSEPNFAKSGKYAGVSVFHEEESRGLQLMNALTPHQQRQAVIGSQIPRDVITSAQVDNIELKYSGLRYDALTADQQRMMLDLVETYVGRVRSGHAAVRMAEVEKHLSETYFGWIGQCDKTNPFYYRVYSPVILIEFDHLPGIIWDNAEPTRDHIHTVVRTPNGNDYGRDLLRQHYHQHDHSHPHTPHRRGLI
jgi:hypothetical protein